ncbi:MAG: hypothetical protein V1735_03050 [Nanoarchaeota archaeon]
MALKTFNIEESVYRRFSALCKANGISMSKQVEFFIRSMVDKEPKVRKEYLAKLERIRKGPFIRVNNLEEYFSKL